MKAAVAVLEEFGVAFEARVVSAHRTPELMVEYAQSAVERGLRVIIAGAGGAAHLPGNDCGADGGSGAGSAGSGYGFAGVRRAAEHGADAKGVPVGTLAIGTSGAANAGLLAVAMLGTTDKGLQERLIARRAATRDAVLAETLGTGVSQ